MFFTSQSKLLSDDGDILSGDHDFLPILQNRLEPSADSRPEPADFGKVQDHGFLNPDKAGVRKLVFDLVEPEL